jgi:hypothetical protein
MPGGSEIARQLGGIGRRSRQGAYHNPNRFWADRFWANRFWASPSWGVSHVGCSQMAQTTFDSIARDRVPDSAIDHETNPWPRAARRIPLNRPIAGNTRSMNHQRGPTHTEPTSGRPPEVLRAAHSQRSRQHYGRSTRSQADRRLRPLRRRAEMTARPARVRIRRRKPWVRLRRRLLGWNVRLLTGKLPHLRSARQIGYGADTARIAGGAGRCQRPLWKRPSNGTGHRQTGQTDANSADANSADALGGIEEMSGNKLTSMSSGHAEQHGEYRRLGCTPTVRLLASPFASQFLLSYRSRRRSVVNLDGGGR